MNERNGNVKKGMIIQMLLYSEKYLSNEKITKKENEKMIEINNRLRNFVKRKNSQRRDFIFLFPNDFHIKNIRKDMNNMSSEVRAMVDDILFLKIDNKVLRENKKKAEVIRELLKKGFENENIDTIINQLLEQSSQLEDLEEIQNKIKKDSQKDRFILYQILYVVCNCHGGLLILSNERGEFYARGMKIKK